MFLSGRLSQLRNVLAEAWPTWLALVGVAGAVGVSWLLAPTWESRVQVAGMFLQLLGLSTVAFGLSQMRRLFGRPSVAEKLAGWSRRFVSVFSRQPAVHAHLNVQAGAITLSGGKVRLRHGVSADAPIDRRVNVLEEHLRLLQEQVDEDVDELRRRIAEVKAQGDREAQERRQDDERTVLHLEEVAVGGLHLESVGLLWLALGVVGTSVPAEIAACLAWLL